MVSALFAAALHRPGEAFHLLKRASALLPPALVSLQDRARLLAAVTRIDEWSVMHLPLAEGLRWRRFRLAHRRLTRTEQMLWMARNPLPALRAGPGTERWPISTIGQYAIVGLHALEYSGGEIFRWTRPVFLLRLQLDASKGTLTLETRKLRPQIDLSEIIVVVGGRILPAGHIACDDAGNINVNIEAPYAPPGETDVVFIVRELREPSSASGPGRRLGLPLFSIGLEGDNPDRSSPRP